MRVRPAHAERRDTGDPQRVALPRPRLEGRLDREVEVVEGNRRVRGLVVEAGRQQALADAEGGLDQADDAGGALEVADVGLGRAHRERGAVGPGGAQHRAEGGRLDGVAHRGAGAVEFDVPDLVGGDAGALVGASQHRLLGLAVGGGQGLAAAVVVDGAAADGERLEDDDAAALAAHEAVGAGVEGVAAAVRREGAHQTHAGGAVLGEDQVDAADDREPGLAAAQALAGEVDGDQRRGLRGVHGEAGAAQAQQVGEAVRGHAAVEAGRGVAAYGRGGTVQQRRVVVRGDADEDGGVRAGEAAGHDSGVLQGRPAEFEHHALLRVRGGGLAGRHSEEGGVEFRGVLDRTAPGVVGLSGDRVSAGGQQFPELVDARCSRKTAGHADDGDVGRVPRTVLRGHEISSFKEIADVLGKQRTYVLGRPRCR